MVFISNLINNNLIYKRKYNKHYTRHNNMIGYYQGTRIFYIHKNKIKKGIIYKIKNGRYYIRPFWFCFFAKREVFPTVNCFLTKSLAKQILELLNK